MSQLIAITGGIGAGKSVISRCVEAMGYAVYDCDSRAKLITDRAEVMALIDRDIAPGCIEPTTGLLNRQLIADTVFNDPQALERLNKLVHGAVIDDLRQWNKVNGFKIAFVETAILYQSNLDKMVDRVWEVTAPREIRLKRIIRRNPALSIEQIEARINTQDTFQPESLHPLISTIINDDVTPVLPQIIELIEKVTSNC